MDINIEQEQWKLVGIKNYEVSNFGRMRNTKYGATYILKTSTNNTKGYERIGLMVTDKLQKTFSVHRLVALAFISNPNNKREVNHKDECKTNNHYSNLEWVTPSENVRHSIITWQNKSKKRKVGQYTLDGVLLQEYPSLISTETFGYESTSICRCCQGIFKTSQGFLWKYL